MSEPVKSRKPPGTPFRQQKLAAWQPIMTPSKVIGIFFAIGIAFVPTGTYLIKSSNDIFQSSVMYDGDGQDVQCSISQANQGKQCPITFNIKEDVTGPVYVYYELQNYYQNHRRYVSSRSYSQLQGENLEYSALSSSCDPMAKNGSLLLNPCGLIANSFFTDVFTLQSSSPAGLIMDETDISWESDREYKFKQVTGFKYAQVANGSVTCSTSNLPSSCKNYYDASSGLYYNYYYPNDDTVQYLYESYPQQISPIEGVTNEHFIVWMRTAGLPTFRKLYGKINSDLKAGDVLNFNVVANYEVDSFGGSKSLVISTVGEFGGQNSDLGVAYIVVGSLCLFFGFLFFLKHLLSPRKLGDPSLLQWN